MLRASTIRGPDLGDGWAPFLTAWDALADLEDDDSPELRLRGKWADLLPSVPEGRNYLHFTERGDGPPLFGWRRRYWNFLLKLAKDQPSCDSDRATGPRNRALSLEEQEVVGHGAVPIADYARWVSGSRRGQQRTAPGRKCGSVSARGALLQGLAIRQRFFKDARVGDLTPSLLPLRRGPAPPAAGQWPRFQPSTFNWKDRSTPTRAPERARSPASRSPDRSRPLMDYRRYRVSARDRAPLLDFISQALEPRVHGSSRVVPTEAPFTLSFEAPDGERLGIIAYAFLANSRRTLNRPSDEHRFQVKYGSRDGDLHEVWQDPFGLYTTILVGINPELGFFVGADPLLHSPTRFFISIEFKDRDVQTILASGWSVRERAKRSGGYDEPVEIMVGGTMSSFLRYIRFERAARGLDAGHRALLAEKLAEPLIPRDRVRGDGEAPRATRDAIHELSVELDLPAMEILDLIESAPRLKMAVRGWVAEVHLQRLLEVLQGISECARLEEDGAPDIRVRLMHPVPSTQSARTSYERGWQMARRASTSSVPGPPRQIPAPGSTGLRTSRSSRRVYTRARSIGSSATR